MAASFTGSSYIELQPGYSYDSRSGFRVNRNFLGEYTALQALAADFRAQGRQLTCSPAGGGEYILQVWIGADDSQAPDQPLASKWELLPNEAQKPVWKLPKVSAAMAYITDLHSRALIRKYAKMVADGENQAVGTDGSTLALSVSIVLSLAVTAGMPSGSAGTDILERVIIDMIDGVETFMESQPVLRNTMIVASNASSSLKPAYDNVNKIYLNKAAIYAAEGVANELMFVIPEGVWLKKGPVAAQVAPDKWSIEREFWWGTGYSNLLYEVAT